MDGIKNCDARFFYVKSEYRYLKVMLDDIVYIEGVKDYVKINMGESRKSIMCLMKMKTLEDFLPQPEFMRVHRSYIVHMPKADVIDKAQIMFGNISVPISDSYRETILQYVNEHTLM